MWNHVRPPTSGVWLEDGPLGGQLHGPGAQLLAVRVLGSPNVFGMRSAPGRLQGARAGAQQGHDQSHRREGRCTTHLTEDWVDWFTP